MSGVGTLPSSAIEVGNVEYAHAGPVGLAGSAGGAGGYSVIVKDNMVLTAWSEYVELSASHHSLNSTNMLDMYCAKKCDKLTLTLRLMLLLLLLLLLLLVLLLLLLLLLLLVLLLLRGLPVDRH